MTVEVTAPADRASRSRVSLDSARMTPSVTIIATRRADLLRPREPEVDLAGGRIRPPLRDDLAARVEQDSLPPPYAGVDGVPTTS